jgi:type II secretory pathway pseudopilin PulG
VSDRARRGQPDGQSGFTLIEVLVALGIGMIVVIGAGSMLISAVRDQPKVSSKAVNIQTARWVMERITTELRNGIVVNEATPSSVSFQAYVRRTACGGTGQLSATSPSIKCQVTITCSTAPQSCVRREAAPGQVAQGTPETIFTGLSNGSSVFGYQPNTTSPNYVKVTITLPDPTGGKDAMTVSDGVTLRNAVLEN